MSMLMEQIRIFVSTPQHQPVLITFVCGLALLMLYLINRYRTNTIHIGPVQHALLYCMISIIHVALVISLLFINKALGLIVFSAIYWMYLLLIMYRTFRDYIFPLGAYTIWTRFIALFAKLIFILWLITIGSMIQTSSIVFFEFVRIKEFDILIVEIGLLMVSISSAILLYATKKIKSQHKDFQKPYIITTPIILVIAIVLWDIVYFRLNPLFLTLLIIGSVLPIIGGRGAIYDKKILTTILSTSPIVLFITRLIAASINYRILIG